MKGILIKAVSSFYYVDTGQELLPCRARGRFRLEGTEPLPGDIVEYSPDPDHENSGILTGIDERKNCFVRPNVANVDQIVFIASEARPKTDPYLIDRMQITSAAAGCDFLLCLNKIDLNTAEELERCYQKCSIPVIRTSAVSGDGIPELRARLDGKLSVLTGNSGVGKTSILNALIPGLQRKTDEISSRHGRGKHTTRHTELFRVGADGWIADTPGFAALEIRMISNVKPLELAACFPEFPTEPCRFPDCLHRAEPFCRVREALNCGDIPQSRYESYLRILNEIQNPERSTK